MVGKRFFASATGDGISDPKNPRVFFKIAENGKVLGDIHFEVRKNTHHTFYISFSCSLMRYLKQLRISAAFAPETTNKNLLTREATSIA